MSHMATLAAEVGVARGKPFSGEQAVRALGSGRSHAVADPLRGSKASGSGSG